MHVWSAGIIALYILSVMFYLKRLLLLVGVVVFPAMGQAGAEDSPAPRFSVDELQGLYAEFGGVQLHAVDRDRDIFIVNTVGKNGEFLYKKFDKDSYQSTYRGHRDAEVEWTRTPANFVYYDGQFEMLSSAPSDPASMYDHVVLDFPLPIGEKIQVLSCVWPVLDKLIDRGVLEKNEFNSWDLVLDDVMARIRFDGQGFVREIVWGMNSDEENPVGRWVYSGYSTDSLLPSTMTQTFQLANRKPQHSHFSLSFDRPGEQPVELLAFLDEDGEYTRRDLKTKNVYDSDGALLYNEDEMAAEYLEALGKGNPKRTRWILLTVLGAGVVGSVWALRKRAA